MRFWVVGVLVLSMVPCLAAPMPALVPGNSAWTLDVRSAVLWSIDSGESPARRYWYVIISIENRTGGDVDLVPQADLATDTFQVQPAGIGVSASLFDLIKARHQYLYPFLQLWPIAPDRIMPGPDHARDYVLVWPQMDTKAGRVSVFIGGLSNEMAVIDHPLARDQGGTPIKVYLRKTLKLDFVISPNGPHPIMPVQQAWVMR